MMRFVFLKDHVDCSIEKGLKEMRMGIRIIQSFLKFANTSGMIKALSMANALRE